MLDLHTHLGGAVPSAVLWELLCDGGLQTEFEHFEDLHEFLTVSGHNITSLDDFLGRYFHATELIQSSPQAAMVSVYQAVGKAYRRASIEGIEIRYNPLKRIRGGLHTLDAIILGTIQGLERASMHYKIKTGAIFSMGKELSIESNEEILEAAIRSSTCGPLHQSYGVVGIDMAGPESLRKDHDIQWLKTMGAMTSRARTHGLGVTWHIGETDHSGPDGIENTLKYIQPHRLGHGIQLRKAIGKQRERLCSMLREQNVCVEICPSVNLVTKSIQDLSEIADFVRMLHKEKIRFCLNTDNPYLIHTNLKREYALIEEKLGKDASMLQEAHEHAKKATFMQ